MTAIKTSAVQCFSWKTLPGMVVGASLTHQKKRKLYSSLSHGAQSDFSVGHFESRWTPQAPCHVPPGVFLSCRTDVSGCDGATGGAGAAGTGTCLLMQCSNSQGFLAECWTAGRAYLFRQSLIVMFLSRQGILGGWKAGFWLYGQIHLVGNEQVMIITNKTLHRLSPVLCKILTTSGMLSFAPFKPVQHGHGHKLNIWTCKIDVYKRCELHPATFVSLKWHIYSSLNHK